MNIVPTYAYYCISAYHFSICQIVFKTISIEEQWWILGEANEAVASGPPSKTAYTDLDSLRGRFGVKTFFFWRIP